MPQRVLSVDTGFDADLRWFASERLGFYTRQGSAVDQIKQSATTHLGFMTKCRLQHDGVPVYGAIAICTHGENGRVYDFRVDIHQELFSVTSPIEDLRVIGQS